MSTEFCPAGSFRRSSTLQARQQIVRFAAQTRSTKETDMFTFTLMRNGFRRAAPFALITAFGLAACGSGYNSSTPYGMSGAASKLFAANAGGPGIGSLVNPDPPTGMVVVDRFFYGSGLTTNIGSLALDTVNDRLYVGNGTSILVYNGASMTSGIPSPDRTITGIASAGSLFIDSAH